MFPNSTFSRPCTAAEGLFSMELEERTIPFESLNRVTTVVELPSSLFWVLMFSMSEFCFCKTYHPVFGRLISAVCRAFFAQAYGTAIVSDY